MAAVVITPVPIGFVSTSTSPGIAPAFVTSRPGSTTPVTAMPNFGSWSSTVCPPTMITPASAALDAAPRITSPRTSTGRPTGKAATLRASIGVPPIA